MPNPLDMVVFAKVVKSTSFSAAADMLGMSPSAVSKHVSRLERALGVRLLNRTTRRLSLTEVGQAVYSHCVRLSDEIAASEQTASQFTTEARGLLRLSAPAAFGRLYVVPAMPDFLGRHPNLSVELAMSDRLVDFVRERFDVAITSDVIPGANLVARKLAPISWVVCATAEYLTRHGEPESPADLLHHNCIFYRSGITEGNVWRFRSGTDQTAIDVGGRFVVNDSEAVREATKAGLGIGLVPSFAVRAELEARVLRPLLREYEPFGAFGSQIWVQYLAGPLISPKIRACVDYFVERFRRELFVGWGHAPEAAWQARAALD